MRLFGYYAWHSFVNQLKKLFKTWVIAFIAICLVVGIAIGLGAAAIADYAEKRAGNAEGEEVVIEEVVENPELEEDSLDLYFEEHGITSADMVELIAGAIILIVFVFMALGADKNGSRIFMPADVSLLFPSPMSPQSVLMFRVCTQMGVAVLGSFYMLFQLPNLILNAGLPVSGGLALILCWCLMIVFGTLLQVLLYALASTYPTVKRLFRPVIYAILLLVAGSFALFWKIGDKDFFMASLAFFNAKVTRWIPVWGWMKAFCRYAVTGEILPVILCLLGIVVGGAIFIYFIWHIKVDFYEDAMAKSEETAEILARAQSEKQTGVVSIRKKDRSDRLKRDGMKYGRGANVFFFKTMYNRFRFGHFGFVTKTMEFYLVAVISVGLLCRIAIKTDSVLPIVLTIGAFVFFRSLGNPLEQDTKMEYFILIPESTWAKLFWSLMGGTACCFLDVLPAIVVGTILVGGNLLTALLWIPVILSVDFYATTVGVFMGVSLPQAAGVTIKQLIQILFIYFGLLPDIAILAIGIVSGHLAIAVFAAVAVNLTLGGLFFGLSPLFIDPQ